MTGGAFKNSSNLLGRRREIEELERSVAALKKDMEEMQKAIDDNRSQRNVIRDTIAEFQEKLRKQYVAQNTAKMNLIKIEEKIKEIQGGYEQIQRDQAELKRQVSDIREDHSQIEKELEASKQDEEELEAFIETRQKELEEWKAEETGKTKELEEIRLEASSLEQKESFAKENVSRMEQEMQDLKEEESGIHEILLKGKEEMEKKEQEIQERKEAVALCLEKEESSQMQMKAFQDEKEEKNTRHKAIFKKRDELSERIGLLDKECFRLKSQMDKIEESRENQISYLWEEYEITPNNAVQYRKEELNDRQEMKKEIGRMKEEIRKLGSVNVNAIEDYKELS